MALHLGLGACVALLLAGCATTRAIEVGALPNALPLVRLVVTEDRGVVGQECEARGNSAALGCQITRLFRLGDRMVRGVTIIRYTDGLPSRMAMEIEAHELCHAVAVLQGLADPCHDGNAGFLQSSLPPRNVFVRP
jgi:hypothetical protein